MYQIKLQTNSTSNFKTQKIGNFQTSKIIFRSRATSRKIRETFAPLDCVDYSVREQDVDGHWRSTSLSVEERLSIVDYCKTERRCSMIWVSTSDISKCFNAAGNVQWCDVHCEMFVAFDKKPIKVFFLIRMMVKEPGRRLIEKWYLLKLFGYLISCRCQLF